MVRTVEHLPTLQRPCQSLSSKGFFVSAHLVHDPTVCLKPSSSNRLMFLKQSIQNNVTLTPLPLFAFQLFWGKLSLVMGKHVFCLPVCLFQFWTIPGSTRFISRIDVTVPKSSSSNPTVYC